MGIYTGNRTSIGSVVESGINMAYANPLGALTLTAESYYNDSIMFEAVITSDFLEAAIEDKSAANETKTNFLTMIWEKIIKLCQAIKAKINGIVDSFIKAMDEFYAKRVKEALAKHEKDFSKADLSKLKVKNFHIWNATPTINLDHIKTILEGEAQFDNYIGKTAEEVAKLKEAKKDAESKIYGKIITKDKATSAEFSEGLHLAYFEKEVNETPFAKLTKKEVLNILGKPVENRTMVRSVRKAVFETLDKQEKVAKQMQKDAKKLTKGDEKTNAIAVANACFSLVSLVQRVAGTTLNHVMKEEKAVVQSAFKLFNIGAKVKEKEAEEVVIATGEAAEYEFDSFFESFEFEA